MTRDVRGWRIALVPDALLNPAAPRHGTVPDMLRVLDDLGYGLLQLPPPEAPALLLAVIADQVAEYSRHGYAVAAVGLEGEVQQGLHWRRLVSLLRARGAAAPPRHVVRPAADPRPETERLVAWLGGFDLPQTERERWRV